MALTSFAIFHSIHASTTFLGEHVALEQEVVVAPEVLERLVELASHGEGRVGRRTREGPRDSDSV